ncbi:MAG: AIR synthase-related protein, partial [Bacteroidia bacterium]
LTSARHDVFSRYIAEKYPESYDTALPKDVVYCGQLRPGDLIDVSYKDASGKTVTEQIAAGKLVLSPTRTYAPVVKELLKTLRGSISGIVHCSGGAQTKVLHFVNDVHIIKDNLFPVPPLFKLIHEQSHTDYKEMYKVFNMGHRLEIYLPKERANEVIAIAQRFNIDAQIIGKVEAYKGKKVTIRSEFGTFEY